MDCYADKAFKRVDFHGDPKAIRWLYEMVASCRIVLSFFLAVAFWRERKRESRGRLVFD